MPAAELQRFATYCRSMAEATARTVDMARADIIDARAAARQGDTSYPLTPTQALAIKCGLQREERLWRQLATEIDDYLGAVHTDAGPDLEGLADLFTTTEPDEGTRTA